MDDIDQAASDLQDLVMDELPELGWDPVSCARVLMNLASRLENMADELVKYPDILAATEVKP